MLTELLVENFGLIEQINVRLSSGFNVITGETGAGKSLIIDAVGLLIGGRGSQEFIRTGADRTLIQGVFTGEMPPVVISSLTEAGLDPEDESLILTREISRSGKSICRINFRTVTLSLYRTIGKNLVNIHGQHEHVALLEEENQSVLLDSYGGEELLRLRERVKESFGRIRQIQGKLDLISAQARDAAQKMDFLRYQIKEIEDSALLPHEDEILEKEKRLLQNAEKLTRESRLAYEKLYGSRQPGARDLVGEAVSLLKGLSLLDDQINPIFEKINEAYYLMEDLTRELGAYSEKIASDPGRLDEIEKRLALINKLKKKYAPSLEGILAFACAARKELDDLEHQEENVKGWEESLEKEWENYHVLSTRLTGLRQKAGAALAAAVTGELHQLQMPAAQFFVRLEKAPNGPQGTDGISFLISPNPGEELKPVMRIASGGEMSRIMLGIKVILAQLDQIPTLIFDEIDSGLGGKVVYAVGEKMDLISACAQVICVTHSPVIASFADTHLNIRKETKGGRTITEFQELQGRQIIDELGRMLAGDNVTEITVAQVRELLKTGQRKKKF